MSNEPKNIMPGGCCGQDWWPVFPPKDIWRNAVLAEAALIGMGSINDLDPRATLAEIIRWHVAVSLDPRVSNAVALPVRAPGELASMPLDEDGTYPDWW